MRGKIKTRSIAYTAVFTAFSTLFLYLASVMPSGQLGFLGIASLFGIAAVVEFGMYGGITVLAGTAVLGLIIVPSKTLVGLYAVFFGLYPIVKSLAERRGRVFEWCVKVIFFNLALTAAVFALKVTVFDLSNVKYGVPILYCAGNAVFVLFDIGVSRVIAFYMARIYPKIHK